MDQIISAKDLLLFIIKQLSISGCETIICVSGMSSILCSILNKLGQLIQKFLIAIDDGDDRNLGKISAILFFVLALQTGLTEISAEQRFVRLYQNLCLLLTANLYIIHGAGFHKSEEKYRKCLIESTQSANQILKGGGSALDAVVKAIEVLENDGITNCGRGSALNLNCEVQCDASLMQSSDLHWAGVGSVPNLKNPILAAKCLLLSQQKRHPDGLINPCLLVGEGAKKWAIEHGCLESNDLVTDQAMDLFEKHRLEITKLKEDAIKSTIDEQFKPIKKRKFSESLNDSILMEHGYSGSSANSMKQHQKVLDTVGAIAVDDQGVVAAAVSSGGIMFKDEGRIGQAGSYGAGVWTEDNVAVTSTGVGEYLIKTLFAKDVCANELLKVNKQLNKDEFDDFGFDDVIKDAFVHKFLNSKYLKTADHDKLIGLLSLVAKPEEKRVHLIYAHNTPSMFLAYATGDQDTEMIFSKTSNSAEDHVEARTLFVQYE